MRKSYRLAAGFCLLPLLLVAGYYAGLFEKAPTAKEAPPPAPAAAEDPNPRVRLNTVDLMPPLGKIHRIYLSFQRDAMSFILLDERDLKLDIWGDNPDLNLSRQEGWKDLKLVPISNMSGDSSQRALYDLTTEPASELRLQLVAPADGGQGTYRLLVLDSKNQITRVVTLEHWTRSPNPRGIGAGAAS